MSIFHIFMRWIFVFMIGSLSHAESLTVESSNLKLHVEVDGTIGAPPLLLWNGGQTSTRMWDLTIPRLVEYFCVIRFDVRGTGLSEANPANVPYLMEQHAADANAILDALGIDKVNVWAMAWGSRAAIIHAALYPERVSLLALNDASVDLADLDAQASGRALALEKQVQEGTSIIKYPENWNFHKNPDEALKAMRAIRVFDDQEGQLNNIRVPTLISTGEYDPNLSSSKKIAKKITDAELIIMKNVAHGSVLQRPDLTVDNFLNFVRYRVGVKR